jgi:hypothetical protein|tara:strand:- start:100 stop:333 length:234 start_codon:yes stop_codon:yes gene_type:complete
MAPRGPKTLLEISRLPRAPKLATSTRIGQLMTSGIASRHELSVVKYRGLHEDVASADTINDIPVIEEVGCPKRSHRR